jgi:tetratricopeptide (TPR) repeat protein
MAKKKNLDIPEINPDDTAPVVIDALHEGKTMQVRIAPGTTRPLSEVNSSLEETQSVQSGSYHDNAGINMNPPGDPPTQPLKVGKPKRGKWIWLGILLVLIGIGVGGGLGYKNALDARMLALKNAIALKATEQFQLAVSEQAAGNLDIARKRLEYIVQLNPDFPGVTQKLTEVMMAQAAVRTPTAVVEVAPTPVPTKDTRNSEELFTQARQQMANKEWNAALTTLDSLRQNDKNYRAIQVDGLMYIALRNRGIARINTGMLEQGIYDITMAGQFGPLDHDAISQQQTAGYYLASVAAWAVDWPKVLENLTTLMASAPGIRDASGMSAAERYRKGSILYGDKLLAEENPCDAATQYQNALNLSVDETTQAKFNDATNKCTPPTEEAAVQPTTAVEATTAPEAPTATTEAPTVAAPVEPTAETPAP